MPCRWFTSLMLLGCVLLAGAQRVGAAMLSPEKIASGVRGVIVADCTGENADGAPETQRVAEAVATEVVLGRSEWLSKDPIGEDGGVNLYAFCDNNPINGIDYLGEKTVFNNARVTGFNYEDNDPKNSDRTVTGRYRVDKKKPVYGYKSGKPNYKPNKKHKTPTNYETGLGYYRADLTAATYDDPSTLAVSKAVLDKCPYGSKVWIPEIGWFVVESFAGAGSADDPRFDLWMATASRSSFYSIDGRYCVTCYARGETPAESDSQPGPKWSRYKDWVNASRIDMYRDLDKWMGVYVDGVLTGYEPPKE